MLNRENSMHSAMIVVGTRPEIIKMAPLVRAFQKRGIPFELVHCGQHYDYNMSQQFIEELELPCPNYGFKFKAHTQASQTAEIMVRTEKLLQKVQPGLVLVEGDTNTVLAASLTAVKLHVPVGHVEAGLRSFDLRMPEEHNRRLTDHVSTYLFAPTATAETNLRKENVWGKIYVTGNTIVDAVTQHLSIAQKKSTILKRIRFREFILATAHRAENVDDSRVLSNLIKAFERSSTPIVYPLHPHTKKRLMQYKLYADVKQSKNIQILPPLGYLDVLILMKKCAIIVTDSGGIQEEATVPVLRKHVLVIRSTTERPEAVEAGFAKVVGTKKKDILRAIKDASHSQDSLPTISPYGDGKAADKIARIVEDVLV